MAGNTSDMVPSVASEMDFRDITNKLGPDELQLLFHNLGIQQRDIEHAEKSADTIDTKLKARAVLRWWKKTEGRKATYERLHVAKRKLSQDYETSSTNKKRKQLSDTEKIVQECQSCLKDLYRRRRSKIKFGSSSESVADSESIFVSLKLLHGGKIVLKDDKKQLDSYLDLLSMKYLAGDKKEHNTRPCTHVLLSGYAGCGKSTLINKLAHDWARFESLSPSEQLSKFKLVIVLDVRRIEKGVNLESTVHKQLLPKQPAETILNILQHEIESCLYLLDGFDEVSSERIEDMAEMLDNPLMNWVIMSTRPHMVSIFNQHCQSFQEYVHVEVSGFSKLSIGEYVNKFFQIKFYESKIGENHAKRLLERIRTVPILESLSSYPILLLMLCHLWLDRQDQNEQDLPDNLTELYKEAIEYLNKHWLKRYKKDKEDVMAELGGVAIKYLFQDQLNFSGKEDNACLNNACEIGLLTREEKDRHQNVYSFIHKTFQEFCAAFYMANLLEDSHERGRAEFSKYLEDINNAQRVDKLEYFLWFCCGLSAKAASFIIPHVVSIRCKQFEKGGPACGGSSWLQLICEDPDENTSYRDYERETVDDQIWNLPLKLFNETVCQTETTNENAYDQLERSLSKSGKGVKNIILSKYVFQPYPVNLGILMKFLKLFGSALENIGLYRIPVVEKLQKIEKTITCSNREFELVSTNNKSLECDVVMLIPLLLHMPLLETLTMVCTDISCQLNVGTSVQFTSIRTFNVRSCGSRPNMKSIMKVVKLLMPLLEKLSIIKSEIEEWSAEDLNVCKMLKDFKLSATDNIRIRNMTERQLFTLMDSVKSLEKITLRGVLIEGNAEFESNVPSRIYPLKVFIMSVFKNPVRYVSNTLLAYLLNHTPFLEQLTLSYFQISGNLEANMSFQAEHLKEVSFSVSSYNVQGNTILMFYKLYKYLSSVERFSYIIDGEIKIKGVIESTHLLKVHKLRREIEFMQCSMSAETLMFVLRHISSLRILKVTAVSVIGNSDKQSNTVKELIITKTDIEINTLFSLLSCMPSIKILCFKNSTLTGTLSSKILLPCKSITFLCLTGNKINGDVLVQILSPIMNLEELVFEDVEITGDLPLDQYAKTRRLEVVRLSYHKIGRHTIQRLIQLFNSFSEIKILILDSKYNDPLLQILSCSSFVERLELRAGNVHGLLDATLSSQCKLIKELEILSDSGKESYHYIALLVKVLQMFPALKKLSLRNVGLATSIAASENIGHCLEELKMSFTRLIQEHALIQLTMLTSLKKLHLTNTFNMFNKYDQMKILPISILTEIPDLEELQLMNVLIKTNLQSDTPVILKSLKILSVNCHDLSPHDDETLEIALRCAPSLHTLELRNMRITIQGSLHVSKSIRQLSLIRTDVTRKTMSFLFNNLTSLQALIVHEIVITPARSEFTSVPCKMLTQFEIKTLGSREMTGKQLNSLFTSMPSLQSLRVIGLHTFKELYDDKCVSVLCPSLETLVVLRNYDVEEYSKSDNEYNKDITTILAFARQIPSLSEFRLVIDDFDPSMCNMKLHEMELRGRVGYKVLTKFEISCKQKDEEQINQKYVNAEKLSHLLGCMPVLKELYLCKLKIIGLGNKLKNTTFTSLTELRIIGCQVAGQLLLIFLSKMPSLEKLLLEDVDIEWTLDTDVTLMCEELQECSDIDENKRQKIRELAIILLDQG